MTRTLPLLALPALPALSRAQSDSTGKLAPRMLTGIVTSRGSPLSGALYAQGRRFLVYVNLGDLAARLDPQRFVRVHRSHVVNLDWIAEIVPHDPSRLQVKMKDGSAVTASRAGTQALRARLKA
jgi:two-component system LytT family response regulator